jgi:hypothetical protein
MRYETKHSPVSLGLVASLIVGGVAVATFVRFHSDDSLAGSGTGTGRSLDTKPTALVIAHRAAFEATAAQPPLPSATDSWKPEVLLELPGVPAPSPDAVPGRTPGVRLGDVEVGADRGLNVLASLAQGQGGQASAVATLSPGMPAGDVQVSSDGLAVMRTLAEDPSRKPAAAPMLPEGDVQVMPDTGMAIMLSVPDPDHAPAAAPMAPGVGMNMLRMVPGMDVRVLRDVPEEQSQSQPAPPGKP